jgi:sugar O-acyltransferase (sialic acid O-acetyltransferase NeuD family)
MKLLLVGAGGHARPVAEAAADNGHEVIACAAGDRPDWLDAPMFGDDDPLPGSISGFVVGLGGVDPEGLRRRLELFRRYAARSLTPVSLVHSRAFAAADVVVADGVTVLAGALVNAGARIAEAAIINTGAIVEHDAVIEAGAHVAPGAILLGATHIGSCAMVGAGAVVLPGATVPADTLVPSLTRYPQ